MVSPNANVVSSPYGADHQPYKGKQGSVGKNQLKLSKGKDQRRNQESMEMGIKPNHSPMVSISWSFDEVITFTDYGTIYSLTITIIL